MSITEHQRNQLHNTLTDKLGTEEADTMVALLPPVGWADVATTRDIDLVRGEIGQLRRDFDNQLAVAVAQLRQEMAESREQLHKDIGEVHRTVSRLTWTMTLGMLGTVIAAASLAFSAATFF
jgi:hypothetical protein